jgi:hypothetical protein
MIWSNLAMSWIKSKYRQARNEETEREELRERMGGSGRAKDGRHDNTDP